MSYVSRLPVTLTCALVGSFMFLTNSSAGEKVHDEAFWNNLRPMSYAERKAFDKVAATMYREGCDCYTFFLKGNARILRHPLNTEQRWLLQYGIKDGWILPISPKGRES